VPASTSPSFSSRTTSPSRLAVCSFRVSYRHSAADAVDSRRNADAAADFQAGTYLLTAFAAQDFYPHIGGIPIVIVLSSSRDPARLVLGVIRAAARPASPSLAPMEASLPAASRPSRLYRRVCRKSWPAAGSTRLPRRGTNGGAVRRLLEGFGLPIHWVDEFETSRAARCLYFVDHPPAAGGA